MTFRETLVDICACRLFFLVTEKFADMQFLCDCMWAYKFKFENASAEDEIYLRELFSSILN